MVRAGRGGKKSAIVYTEDPASGSEEEDNHKAGNGSKRANEDAESDYEDPASDAEVKPKSKAPPKKKAKAAAPPPVYKDASSDDDVADDGEIEGDDSDFEVDQKKTPAKKTPAKKTPAKKTPAKKKTPKKAAAKKKPVAAPSRASGRERKVTKYEDEESEDEEEPESESEDEAPAAAGGRGRPAKQPAKAAKSKAHPPISEMVPAAIKKLNENPKKGSSLAAIKGFMAEEWGVNIKFTAGKIKNFIINAVEDGELIQTKGKGANGRFTVKGMKRKVTKKKKKKKVESEDEGEGGDELEYKPVKSARDEERERDFAEKEERRLARQEAELRKEMEKANKPKREVIRRTEWEVEYIKAMKVVEEKAWYQVKFDGWKKLSWEPEENLNGCQDVIDNFLLEEKVRLKEEEEKRRREEEEGKYEVGRILEVKFPKSGGREFLIRWKGHGEELDSWEPEDNLDCRDLIQRFMDKHEKVMEASEKQLRIAPKRVERLQFAASHRVGKRNQGFRHTYEGMDSDGDY